MLTPVAPVLVVVQVSLKGLKDKTGLGSATKEVMVGATGGTEIVTLATLEAVLLVPKTLVQVKEKV